MANGIETGRGRLQLTSPKQNEGGLNLNTVITLPDGKRIIITPQANPRIVKMVNNVLHKMNEKKRR